MYLQPHNLIKQPDLNSGIEMELNWLEDFISLANTGSFSKAATHRNVSQSAFSRRIHSLENWLGTSLIDRHTHPISLTDAGTQLVDTANLVIRTIYKIREDFGYRERTRLRTLNLGVADHLAVHFVPAWLQSVRAFLGDRKIQLVTGLKAGMGFVELLKDRELDFLLAYGGSVSKRGNDSSLFRSVTLGSDELLPVCKTTLRKDETYHFPTTAEKPVPFVGYMPASAMANLVNQESIEHANEIHLKPVMETGAVETIRALVLEGFGMAWLPYTAIREDLKLGLLTEMGDKSHRIPFTIELYRYTANTRPEVILLWDKLRAGK
jgi:DNA-binding transcriptional LysR family regulator